MTFSQPQKANFAQGDTINFEIVLQGDTIQDFSKLTITWRSNIDGIIKEVKGVKDLKLSDTTLSVDEHIITVEIKNELDSVKKSSFTIQKGVGLLKPEKTDHTVILRWKKYEKANFKAYKIVRHRQNRPVDTITITNQATTTFTDDTVWPGDAYKYTVVLSRTNGTLKGNERSLVAGTFIEMDYPIRSLVKDPFRDRIYALVAEGPRSYPLGGGNGIIVVNTKDLKIEARLLKHISCTDMTISLDGKYMYLADESTTIQKIELETLTSAGTIETKSLGVYHLEAGSNNRLYYYVTPPTSGTRHFGIVDLANNIDLPYKEKMKDQPFNVGDFDIDPATNTIYHVEALNGGNFSKITTTSDIFELPVSFYVHSAFGKLIFNSSKQRLFVNEQVYDRDLNFIGEFYDGSSEALITAVSPSGNLALSLGDLYDVNTFKKIKSLTRLPGHGIFLNDKQLICYYTENPLDKVYKSRIFRYGVDN
ncbi:hypothetical protein [Pedobacter ginsengisoli]|uniref:hypothetical protein n=1 Tax=Pedobacter ginsengisoli TaxID=363852 RepID=UPI00254F53EC|nr:hypothetical protein [Pedobacter ginsengisoli]